MSINAINASTPFLIGVPNSRISPEWIRLFLTLVGGSGSSSTDDLQAYVYGARIPASISNQIQELQSSQFLTSFLKSQVTELARRINDIESMMPSSKTTTSADSVSVIDDTATNLTVFPVWSDGINGNRRPKVSSSQWTFNPSTGNMVSTGSLSIYSATAVPAGGAAGKGLLFSSTANLGVFFGSGAPTLAAAKGSAYLRSDGAGTTSRMYINTDGGTTWTAVTTVA